MHAGVTELEEFEVSLTVRHSCYCGWRLQSECCAGLLSLTMHRPSLVTAEGSPRCASHSRRAPQLRIKQQDALDMRRRDVS